LSRDFTSMPLSLPVTNHPQNGLPSGAPLFLPDRLGL
jgi:hypothetical protein